MAGNTVLQIQGNQFLINGRKTYEGVSWNGRPIEGLLLNTRMVQGIFDDLNPETRDRWAYPDTGIWDPDRNTSEFIDAMPTWLEHGVLAFTLNLQGGSPYGYSEQQPWVNSALNRDGTLRDDYLVRLQRILDHADALGMAVILGIYYFGQEKQMADPAAILRGVENTADWILEHGHRNVLLEINNECNVRYTQRSLQPDGVHALISAAKKRSNTGHQLMVGTSYGGGFIPTVNVVRESDFLLLHGNRVLDPDRIRHMVRLTRMVEGYRPMPILFNEDDHYDFDKPDNNFIAAVDEYASWGFFDYRFDGEASDDGYQSVPVNWAISSKRKREFFGLAKRISTGN